MLKNYDIDHNGVIFQKEKNLITYDEAYATQYDKLGELSNYMAHLRFGYIVGAISRVPYSILDVGYGNGAFLKVCSTMVKECYGNDISGYKVPDNCKFVEKITKTHFDVITFFDSLEHFDSIEFVRDLDCNFICITVPWCHNHNDTWFKTWKHRKENEHIFHFNPLSLTLFMQEMGFDLQTYSNVEDIIRRGNSKDENILTAIFKRK